MHALRRLTPVLEHALVHLDATLFIFGLIFKISAIIYTYAIEKTKKTMYTEFIIISILILVCISVYIYSIFEVLHVLLKPKQYKDHPLVFKFCQVDVACVITTIVLIILNYFGKFGDDMAFLIGLCVAYHGLAAIPTVFIDLDRWSDKDIN